MDINKMKQGVYRGLEKTQLYIREGCYRAKKKVTDAGRWVLNNPDKAAAVMAAGATLAGTAGKLTRSIHRNVTMRQEIREKRTRIYDHSLNAYVYTKRPLSAEQIEFVNRERRRTGKRVSEILYEMDLLRR